MENNENLIDIKITENGDLLLVISREHTVDSTQDDYYRPGDWWHNQPTVTYRGYTGDTITTTTTTDSNCTGQTCMDGFNVNEGDTTSEANGY